MLNRLTTSTAVFSRGERVALAELAERLWDDRNEIAIDWAKYLVAALPEIFFAPEVTKQIEGVGRIFLTVGLDKLLHGDVHGLTEIFYDMNRRLIDADVTSVIGRRIELPDLYVSAQAGLRAIEERLIESPNRILFAHCHLSNHLMLVVGLAHSDSRADELQRARDDLEKTVAERTAELAKEKAVSDTIIATLPGLFFLVDHRERLVRWNKGLEEVSGRTAAEIAERHPLDFFEPSDRPFLQTKMRQAYVDGASSAEAELIAADGSRHPRLFNSRRVELDQGPCLVGVGIDISERRRAEERVQREKRFANNIIESLPGIFYLFDASGHFLRWNKNFEQMSQYTGTEIAGMHPLDFFHGDDRELIKERMAQVFASGQSTAEARFVSRNGSSRPFFFTGRRVVVDDRTCLIGMGIDITERKRAEDELRRARTAQMFAALLESAPDAMVVTDRHGAIILVNSESERLFGHSRDQLLGQPIGKLIAEDVAELRTATSVEATGCRRDGSRFPIEIKISPLETEDGRLITSAIRDITERKHAEAEIRNLNTSLERRVAERTAELARSNSDLEQFAYVTSHDLQEPLRAIASYTELFAERYRDLVDDEGRHFLDRTVAAVSRMQELIHDLLAYSRIGTRKTAVALTDCNRVLAEVLDDLHAAIQEAGATISHDELPVIPADRSQLRQLFQNLIGNALKFHGPSSVEIHIAASGEDDGSWLFRVRDNGIGIPPQYGERVFAIFRRLHSRRAYPGTGVGLAICKKIVERHGGSIWVDPASEPGTTLCFRLPAGERDETSSSPGGMPVTK